jgi:hypothetical protein
VITAAVITLGRTHGARFQLRADGAPALASLRPAARAADATAAGAAWPCGWHGA